MDYSNIIHTICDPFLHNPDSLIVREAPTSDEKSVTLLIYAEAEDTARLIGKKGAVLPGDLQTTFASSSRKLAPTVSSLKLRQKATPSA